MNIKCIGCFELLREELELGGKPLVVYKCPRFPYACALSGLLRPGLGVQRAVEDCHENPEAHCILCPETETTHYGDFPLVTCEKHYEAWSRWLDAHPDRRQHMHPRGRSIKANWIEVFREYIEDMRKKGG